MSESEFSLESYDTWRPVSVCTYPVTDGLNLRELILDGLDRSAKNAIIDFLKAYQLEVTGVDSDTYTVDLTKWDRNRSEQFVQLLKNISGKVPETQVKFDEEVDETLTTGTAISALTSVDSTEVRMNLFEESRPTIESDMPRIERRIPIQPHPAEELDFEYFKNPKPFPVQTRPVYQTNELLNLKPMLMTEETQSTMGSANIGVRKIKKSHVSLKCVINCIIYPFHQLKRLKICRFIRKHMFKTKSKEEKMKKEKAFAVYTSLLEEGPRLGREFRASLKDPISMWRTVATNTWARPLGDDWSLNSEASKINRGINAVRPVVDIGVNTRNVIVSLMEEPGLQEIPKIFSDPEEEPIIWCPCQFITSSFLYKCISKCLKYICDWEDCNAERVKQDIANQKEELIEVRSMLLEALERLDKTRKSNTENHKLE